MSARDIATIALQSSFNFFFDRRTPKTNENDNYEVIITGAAGMLAKAFCLSICKINSIESIWC
ncbi:MAG TPA: hypothetical protein VH396_17660 [Chitinophagaceae bacterium]